MSVLKDIAGIHHDKPVFSEYAYRLQFVFLPYPSPNHLLGALNVSTSVLVVVIDTPFVPALPVQDTPIIHEVAEKSSQGNTAIERNHSLMRVTHKV